MFSTELCGGTHVRRTGDIGLFKIVSEGAVGAGVRRIEAVTGAAAEAYVAEQQRVLNEAAAALKTLPADLDAAHRGAARRAQAPGARADRDAQGGGSRWRGGSGPAARSRCNGVTLAARLLDNVPAKELKGMADEIKHQIGSGVVALVAVADGKASLVVGVTDDLTEPAQRRRPGEGRQRGARRAGRRRPPRHGPGRRPRRLARQGRAGRDRERDRRGGEGGGVTSAASGGALQGRRRLGAE